MKTKTKIIIIAVFYILSLILAFCLGRNLLLKQGKDSATIIEEDVEKMKSKLADIEKRNEELLDINNKQQIINDELKAENLAMKEDLDNIKSVTNSTKEKLDELEKSTDESTSIIKQLKENQKIFREFFENVLKIMEK